MEPNNIGAKKLKDWLCARVGVIIDLPKIKNSNLVTVKILVGSSPPSHWRDVGVPIISSIGQFIKTTKSSIWTVLFSNGLLLV